MGGVSALRMGMMTSIAACGRALFPLSSRELLQGTPHGVGLSAICHYCGLLPWVLEGGGTGLIGDIWECRKNYLAPYALPLGSEPRLLEAGLVKYMIDEKECKNDSLRAPTPTPVLVPALQQVVTPWANHFPPPGSIFLYL